MVLVSASLKEDYWETLEFQTEDIVLLYDHLLEIETPLTPHELVLVMIQNRIESEQEAAENQRNAGGQPYLPENDYKIGDKISFPAQEPSGTGFPDLKVTVFDLQGHHDARHTRSQYIYPCLF